MTALQLTEQFHLSTKDQTELDITEKYLTSHLFCKEYTRYRTNALKLRAESAEPRTQSNGSMSFADLSFLMQSSEILLPQISTTAGPVHNIVANSFELYVIAFTVADTEPGIYHCSRARTELVPLPFNFDKTFWQKEIRRNVQTKNPTDAQMMVILTIRHGLAQANFGDRGYRYLLLASGKISERIDTAAAALGLSSIDLPNISDTELELMLHIDGITETTVATKAIYT